MKKSIALLMSILIIFFTALPISASSSRTYYKKDGVQSGSMSYPKRKKFTVSTVSSKRSQTKKRWVGTVTNNTSYTATKSFSYQVTESHGYSTTYSASLSPVDKEVISYDVRVTTSYQATYQKSWNLTASAKVPPHSQGKVYLAYDVLTYRYKYVTQEQINRGTKWTNLGSPQTYYVTETIKIPNLIV